jgi:aromatic ring-cleaving dioxygenase
MVNIIPITLLLGHFFTKIDAYLSRGHKTEKKTVNCHAFPQIMSWHAHITFMLTSQDEIAKAVALREEAFKEFADLLGSQPVCQGTPEDPSGRYDNGRFCMIEDHDITNSTLGPFPVGEWSMFVPVHYYNRVVPWFQQHRGEFSLLVHPNTGCEYEDHGIWAQWTGPSWNLDTSIFTPWTQTESFGQHLGTTENPACLTSGGICADFKDKKQYYDISFAPQIVCCAGMACKCDGAKEGHCTCQ